LYWDSDEKNQPIVLIGTRKKFDIFTFDSAKMMPICSFILHNSPATLNRFGP
jgi:hypothetical protein